MVRRSYITRPSLSERTIGSRSIFRTRGPAVERQTRKPFVLGANTNVHYPINYFEGNQPRVRVLEGPYKGKIGYLEVDLGPRSPNEIMHTARYFVRTKRGTAYTDTIRRLAH